MRLDDRFVIRNPEISHRTIDGNTLVVKLSDEGSKLLVLNRTGSVVWELADGEHSIAMIIEKICHNFDVPNSRAKKDTFTFIESLMAKGLLLEERLDDDHGTKNGA